MDISSGVICKSNDTINKYIILANFVDNRAFKLPILYLVIWFNISYKKCIYFVSIFNLIKYDRICSNSILFVVTNVIIPSSCKFFNILSLLSLFSYHSPKYSKYKLYIRI